MAGAKIALSSTTGELKNDGNGNALVALPGVATPAAVGAVRVYQVDDDGTRTGDPHLSSFEVDEDSRARVGEDALIDEERFNYTAQNTGKFAYRNTTATAAWSAAGMQLSASGVTPTTTDVGVQEDCEAARVTAVTHEPLRAD